jgi:hypothetical protein
VARLHASLPPRTLLVVFSGHGDMVAARRVMARQDRLRKAVPPGVWSPADQQELEAAVAVGRQGMCFFALAQAPSTL